jgi:GntR family transcriptional regulator
MSKGRGQGIAADARTPMRRRRADEAARTRDLLRTELLSGRYREGTLLPSETELMLEYAVGRNVVRDCLDLLRQEGLVQRVPGTGTSLMATKAHHRFDRIHAINDAVAPSAPVTGEVLAMTRVTAPRPIATYLDIPAGGECAFLEYTAFIGSTPFSVSSSYLPADVGDRLSVASFQGDFYAFLETAGFHVDGGELTVESVLAQHRTAAALRIEVGAPLVMFHRRLVDGQGRPLEFGYIRCRGDWIALRIELPRTTDAAGIDERGNR